MTLAESTMLHTKSTRTRSTAGEDGKLTMARLCLLLALLLLPWVGGATGEIGGMPVAVWPLALLALLAAGGWLGWAMARERTLLPPAPLRWPLIAWGAVTVVSAVTSVYFHASALALYQVAIILALTVLAFRLPLTRAQLMTGALFFAADYLARAFFGVRDGFLNDSRVQGTWEDANCFAGFLLLGLPLLAVLVRYAELKIWRLVCGAAVVSGVVALLLTQSRGGVLAFFLILLIFAPAWLWAEKKLTGRGIAWLAIGFVVLVGLTLLSPIGKRVLNPQVRAKQLHSQMFRYYTWRGTLRMIRAYPWLGSGPNTFQSVFGQYQIAGYTRHAHQSYLETAAESGWVALLVLLWLLLAVLSTGVRALRQLRGKALPDGERAFLTSVAIAQGASTLGLMLHGLVESDWGYPGIQLLLLLQAAWVWRLIATVEPAPAVTAEAPAAAHPRRRLVFVSAALFLLVLLLLPRVWAEQLADRASILTSEVSSQKPEEQARTLQQIGSLYCQAQSWTPKNAYYLRLAALYTPEKGEDDFQHAQEYEPTNAANWLNYGHFELRKHALSDAAAAYVTAEQKEPNFLPALYGLAQTHYLQGDLAGAQDAVRRILATIGTPVDRYRPIEVPEAWYLQAWYAEGVFAAHAGDSAAAQTAFTRATEAAVSYQQGYSTEAKALAAYTGNGELDKVAILASLAHEQLALLLSAHAPAAAQQQRAAMLNNFPHAADLLQLPFPELYRGKSH